MDHRLVLGGTLLVTSAVAGYSTYKLWRLKQQIAKEDVYETKKSLNEYLLLHYGSPTESLMFDVGSKEALDFPKRCAELCNKHFIPADGLPMISLDVGCAVGRSTFEMTKVFNVVTGVDYSKSFIDTCNELKSQGTILYSMTTEGFLDQKLVAAVDPALDRGRTIFRVADACCLPAELEGFGCVLAANLICRLHRPDMFLLRCSSLVAKGGILVITSPYTFLTQYTAEENMIGGYIRKGRQVTGFDGLKTMLGPFFDLVAEEDMPFLIRETKRKHQWTVAHATVWRRK